MGPIGHEPPNSLVSELFSIKFANTLTHTHTDTSTDNKGRLMHVAHEPISADCCSIAKHCFRPSSSKLVIWGPVTRPDPTRPYSV